MSPGIFVFTAANEAARQNLERSISNPIEASKLSAFPRADVETSIGSNRRSLHAWGVTTTQVGKWNALRLGDWVLGSAHKNFEWIAQVEGKERNPGLAEALWGKAPDGRAWELMFFLSIPQRINVPIVRTAPDLYDRYLGFTRISEDRLRAIETKYESVDGYVQRCLLSDAAHAETITREDVLGAISAFRTEAPAEFGASVTYDLLHEGEMYPPKAIYAMAARRTMGRTLSAGEVSSGDGSVSFRTLRSLGFTVQRRQARSAR